ncbi:hypothetical protein T4B_6823 [Trichinella pseudospiralis]|uniref:Uncharacterized protein n=2 Tax=Trichinella pseudospiralis TaxID=6337 RepID=A0A0V1KFG9_TRIPS|nr:hypothetical protein T4B_6823 [Trichinella pseudospiralis]KRZ45908.1 hypothetical protein T4C_1873 [Trichinella pseudospiralis]
MLCSAAQFHFQHQIGKKSNIKVIMLQAFTHTRYLSCTDDTDARRGARTHDPGIKSPMLYRLS